MFCCEHAMLGYPSYEKSYAHITVRYIFEDNDNWARYRFHHEDELREVEIKEVEKMLRCHDDGRGFFAYQCPKCKKSWVVIPNDINTCASLSALVIQP